MATVTQPGLPRSHLPPHWTLADLQAHLGGIPLARIRLVPPPGYATEDDVIEIEAREDRLYELVDGVLVEKPKGWYESILAGLILTGLNVYLETHDLGQALGADGGLKLLRGVVKIPDVCFIGWKRFPGRKLPRRPIPALVPDLIVEVLSESNTEEEMREKLSKYFEAGVRLVWYVDPATRSASSYSGPTSFTKVGEDGVLDGADVLPGLEISLRELFEKADRQRPKG